MIDAAIAKAAALGVPQSVCVVDDGGHPIIVERMDGARVTGPQIAWNKAFTAAGHKRSTHLFNTPPNGPALPGNEAFGIQWSFDGKFAAFGWQSFAIQGNDMEEVLLALKRAREVKGRPTCILSLTRKGQGMLDLLTRLGDENYHGKALPAKYLDEALAEIG